MAPIASRASATSRTIATWPRQARCQSVCGSVSPVLAGRAAAKVLLYREIRGFYLDADYLWGDPGNQGLIRYADIPDEGGLRRRLAELGVTHVLVNSGLGIYQPGRGDYDAHVVALMDGVLSSGHRVLGAGAFALYELAPLDGGGSL